MRSMTYGRQTPTFERVGIYDHSDGKTAIEMFAQYGVCFIPAQKYEMELYLAKNELGEAEAITIGLSRPRQNGKSFAARYYALWAAFVQKKNVLYSAHNGGTVRKMFKFMCDFIQAHDDFKTKLRPGGQGIYKAQGNEGIYLSNGKYIEFSTRTNSASRGGTYDVIVVDEAQELTDEQRDALMPTTIASDSGDPQTIYLGTPPNPKCPGTVFRDLHDRAHNNDLGDAWWLEWATLEIGNPLDASRWYECNPMMGYRIKERSMKNAAETTAPDSFAREYLGWWSETITTIEHVIETDAWDACKTDEPPEDGLMCVGVKFAADGSTYALAVCIKPAEGNPYIEVVEASDMNRGIAPIARWLVGRKNKIASVGIDGRTGTQPLITRLIDDGFTKRAIQTLSAQQFSGATSMLVNAVNEGAVTHYGQPALDASATLTARRRIGDGFGFETTEQADATLIEACALAYREAMTTKRKPGRKAVVY